MKRIVPLLVIIAVGMIISLHIGRNISKSVGFNWYAYTRGTNIHVGDYIIFRKQSDPLGVLDDGAKLVKQAACTAGMELVTTADDFICDGQYIAKREDPSNMKFEYSGILPKGKIFVIGSHERSYDSRIWGLLDESNIIGTVYPLF